MWKCLKLSSWCGWSLLVFLKFRSVYDQWIEHLSFYNMEKLIIVFSFFLFLFVFWFLETKKVEFEDTWIVFICILKQFLKIWRILCYSLKMSCFLKFCWEIVFQKQLAKQVFGIFLKWKQNIKTMQHSSRTLKSPWIHVYMHYIHTNISWLYLVETIKSVVKRTATRQT